MKDRVLTLEECLCIVYIGWNTDEDLELFREASEKIRLHGRRLQLEYKTNKVNEELKDK